MKRYTLFLLITAALAACDGNDPVKHDIDDAYAGDPARLPGLTFATTNDITPDSVTFSVFILSGNEEILEAGFLFSTDPDMAVIERTVTAELGQPTISVTVYGLQAGQTYYVRAYALSHDNGMSYSRRTLQFIVPEPPVVSEEDFVARQLLGTYSTTDYDLFLEEQEGDAYGVTISQVSGSTDRVAIHNLWGVEVVFGEQKPLIAVVDTVAGTLRVLPTHSTLFQDEYERVWTVYGYDEAFTDLSGDYFINEEGVMEIHFRSWLTYYNNFTIYGPYHTTLVKLSDPTSSIPSLSTVTATSPFVKKK
ncbi:MAG: hypothetical protein LBB27_00940 [Tannerellaceae bacterium]|jgi:hypothetical protein|nr:hypothetical protein [Tannerellaceae bacterium]